ncbi:3-deoxy-D-manno-octulosonic acid transferase [Candidatus Electronema sp. TJ]|uniref:3-deoxy-D-manno-octulosonic acid transferase n=1 Tax=Candidatus Electronema sp. TJ TaxID=3401573 RepID=UPI003AA8D5CA
MLLQKNQDRVLERLGRRTRQIKEKLAAAAGAVPKPVIWIHALSVGEVRSALPLVKGLRESIHPSALIFSATTRSGKELAERLIAPHVDLILFSPLDFPCVVRRFLNAIKPSCFILVETDFWPNWLRQLQQRQIPVMLVNGRISEKSFASYCRFALFFKPMFRCFSLLSMQTAQDRDKMLALGIPAERIVCFGNLKYDLPASRSAAFALPAFKDGSIWVCGSTHPGEEELIFAAFQKIAGANPCVRPSPLRLILAPRKIERGGELLKLACSFGLNAALRSSGESGEESCVLILDTIGELADCYSVARLAFIGGSLVNEGGHNPIEAAVQGVPALFGEHMEDFHEIARDLVTCGGAKVVTAETLAETAAAILCDDALHTAMSGSARQLVELHRGGVRQHVQAVRDMLAVSAVTCRKEQCHEAMMDKISNHST